jgi:hypothetical protein
MDKSLAKAFKKLEGKLVGKPAITPHAASTQKQIPARKREPANEAVPKPEKDQQQNAQDHAVDP